jgi:hypothetical protein
MVRHRSGLTVLVALVLLAGTAAAQDENPIPTKNELTGMLGRTFISNQGVASTGTDVHFGQGLTFEVDYGRRLRDNDLYSVTAEVPVLFNLDENLNFIVNVVPEGYKSYFITPSVRANLLPHTFISPWASAGVGFGHFTSSSTLELGGGPNPGSRGATGAVIQGGFGLDVRVTHTFSIRTGVRDFWSGVPQLNVDTGKSRQHNFFVGSGVIWHF